MGETFGNLSALNKTDPHLTNNNKFCTSFAVFTVLYATLTTILALAAIFGNGLILIVLRKYPFLCGPSNQYLLPVHLAIVHIIQSIILLTYPLETISFNGTVSEIREALVITLFITNGGALCISACKRMFIAFRPFVYIQRKTKEKRVLSVLLIVLWILSLFVGFSSIIMNREFPNDTNEESIDNWSVLSISSITRILSVMLFFIFSTTAITFYIAVYLQFRKGHKHKGTSSTEIPGPFVISVISIIIYIVCWFPYTGVILKPGTSPVSCCACSFVLLIGFLDSALSWMTYPLIDRKFRRCFKVVLFCSAHEEDAYSSVHVTYGGTNKPTVNIRNS